MRDAWETLIELGVPDGAPHRRQSPFSDAAAREALERIDVRALEPARREPLLAWLRGYRHHWPTRWRREMGALGDARIAELEALSFDHGRYLKLRRIAIAHLAERL